MKTKAGFVNRNFFSSKVCWPCARNALRKSSAAGLLGQHVLENIIEIKVCN